MSGVIVGSSAAEDGDVTENATRTNAKHDRATENRSVGPLYRTAFVAVVTGIVGLGGGALAGALTPGDAYVPVTIAVATLIAVLLGWKFDQIAAAVVRRLASRRRA